MSSDLMYPRPRHEDYTFHKVLHDIQENEDVFLEFMETPDEVLDRYELDEPARTMLKERDYRGMVTRGLHPVMVVQFQRRIEWGMSMARATSK